MKFWGMVEKLASILTIYRLKILEGAKVDGRDRIFEAGGIGCAKWEEMMRKEWATMVEGEGEGMDGIPILCKLCRRALKWKRSGQGMNIFGQKSGEREHFAWLEVEHKM
jgi:hypothetical protein